MELDVDVADLLDLEDPARGDPAPRAQRVEPEIRRDPSRAIAIRVLSSRRAADARSAQPMHARPVFPVDRLVLDRRGTSQSDPRPGRRARRTRHRRQLPHRPRPHRRRGRARRAAPSGRRRRSTFDALAGADTVIDIAADAVRTATLNGVDLDVSGYDESTGIPLTGLAAHNVLVVDADCRYSNTGEGLHRFVDPVDDEVYLYSQFETADAKRMFACFDQPDLKATFDVTRDRTRALAGHLQRRDRQPSRTALHTFATTPRMSTYLVALIAGPYARWDDVYTDEHGDIPLGIFCRASLGRVHGRRAAVHRDQAGLRLLPPELRRALRIRQVRPAVRARVQRGRHGERGRGDVPGGLRLPQQGDRATATSGAPRRCCTRWRTCGSATWSR